MTNPLPPSEALCELVRFAYLEGASEGRNNFEFSTALKRAKAFTPPERSGDARKLLAAAMDEAGFTQIAYDLRHPEQAQPDGYQAAALRAIEAALSLPQNRPTEAAQLIRESLYHLRLDERAEQYHRKAEAFLAALESQDRSAPDEPRLNIRCERQSAHLRGATDLNVIRVEREDDGSFTAVTDYWPTSRSAPDGWVPPAELIKLSEKAPKGPWEVETEHDPDAEYGSGPDCDRGFDNFIVFDGIGQLLLSTATSDAKCIVEEPYGDEDGYRQAWDETGKATADFVVAAVNFVRGALAAAPPALSGEGEQDRDYFDRNRPDPGPHRSVDCPYNVDENCPHCGPKPEERSA